MYSQKISHFILVVSIVSLMGCSMAREDMHGTYDYKIVAPGSTKNAIENELGSPDSEQRLEDSTTRSIYMTSRVSKGTIGNLKATRAGMEIFTVGTVELFDPFAISENESKTFVVLYDSDEQAINVSVACNSSSPKSFIEIPRGGYNGLTCSALLKG